MNRAFLLWLVTAALVAVPASSVVAAPGDSAPPSVGDDDDDDDDGPGPMGDDDDDEPGDSSPPTMGDDDDDEPGDSAPPTDDESGDGDDEAEEDDAALDDRYRVDIPGAAEAAPPEDDEAKTELPVERKRRGIVKVIQKKFFLKYRRLEVTPQVGYVGNDNFIRRFSLGAAIAYHINDLLSFEISANYLPNLGETDYKPLTKRFQNEDEVVPDISRVVLLSAVNVALSPIYGKVELGTLRIINYDLYFTAGMGIAYSVDDTEIIRQDECTGNTAQQNKQIETCRFVNQVHLATNAGGGFRIVFNEWIGVRIDARQYTHIEQVFRETEIGLEMKQNFMISLGASFFLPPRARPLN